MSWSADYGRRYAIAVYLVRKLSSTELLQRLKNRGVKHSDYTRGLSMHYINIFEVFYLQSAQNYTIKKIFS